MWHVLPGCDLALPGAVHLPENELPQFAIRPPMLNVASPQTLTFLFTDIEGSTRLWDTQREAMREATVQHNAILRRAIATHGGNAFRVVGDAFCVAFQEADGAVLAAIDAQRALRTHAWGGTPIHVRMGVHSGAVEPTEDEIFRGPSLARAARVMSAAHGDQILATAATVALLEREVLADSALRDLGDHTLRGFGRPERLYQVVVPGLRSEFPPIRTQEAQRTNLPPALTPFIGREQALAEVRDAARKFRLFTLIGSGGTGKTRLAIEAARDLLGAFEDGVWLIELAPVVDSALVAMAIAATLGARAEGDVAPLSLVGAALADKQALLLLDNCEHVIEEVAKIAHALLRAAPRLHLLTTSREALGVEGERVYRVPSMTLPNREVTNAADVVASESAALFVDRARAILPTFTLTEKNAAAVARICRQLDGIPLAIELAAARLTALSVDELARRVDDRFRLLTGGLRTALPRQRTLRALVDWSYDLLSQDERVVLDTLAVFGGGFSLEAAEQVCAAKGPRDTTVLDAIEHLVAKSLVIAEQQHETEPRYRLLETIRQYAMEKLADSGQTDAVRRRHFAYFLELAQRAAEALEGPFALEWLDRVETDHDNVRAALEWSTDVAPADYARLAAAMAGFWETRGHFTEGWTRLEHALAVHGAPDEARLRALIGAGQIAYRLDYNERSDDILTEATALAQKLGDVRGEAQAIHTLGEVRIWRGEDSCEPLALRARALAKSIGDASSEGHAVMRLGQLALGRNEFSKAQSLFLESAAVWQAAGCVLRVPLGMQAAGHSAFFQLHFTDARRLLDAALMQHRRMGNVHDAASTLGNLGKVALNEQRFAEARAYWAESLRTFRTLQDRNCGAFAAEAYAATLLAQGDNAIALHEAEAAAAAFRELGAVRHHALARVLGLIASIHVALGDRNAARQALREALRTHRHARHDEILAGLLEKVAAMHPDAASAPALLGGASALRERSHSPLFPAERAEHERCYAEVRAKRAPEEFDRGVASGHTLTRDEAIDGALSLLKPGGVSLAGDGTPAELNG